MIKPVSEMTEKEILRQQLELLAEQSSKTPSTLELVELTKAMTGLLQVVYS